MKNKNKNKNKNKHEKKTVQYHSIRKHAIPDMNFAWVFGHIDVSTICKLTQQCHISERAAVNGEIRRDSIDRNRTPCRRVRHDPFKRAILERVVVIVREQVCGIDRAIVEFGARNVTERKKKKKQKKRNVHHT
jgi:hypothetical protein